MSRGHKPGHHEPMEETIALIALDLAQSLASLAHGFGDNKLIVPVGFLPTPLANVTVTPMRTGKFQVHGTAIATNEDTEAAHYFGLAVGHGPTVDYSQSVGIRLMSQSGAPAPSPNACAQSNSITMEYGSVQVPLTFTVGTPVTLVLFGQASVDGEVFIAPNEAQITVLELPN